MRSFLASLRAQLLMLALLAFLPLLGLTLYSAFDRRAHASSDAKRTALRLARSVATDQNQLIEGARQLLVSLSEVPETTGNDRAACNTLLAGLLRRFPRYANLGVAAVDGQVDCSGLPLTQPVTIADRAYFRKARETGDFAVGDYQVGRITGKASINFGYPLLDPGGRFAGVVFAALDLSWLGQEVGAGTLLANSVLTVIDPLGTVLARYPDGERFVGRNLPETPVVKAILTDGEGTIESKGVDGVARFYGFAPLLPKPTAEAVYVAVGVPKGPALAPASRALRFDLIVLGLVGAVGLAAAWLGASRSLVRPVAALGETARRLSEGELDARTGIAHSGSELGELARVFDLTAEALQRREQELRQLNEQLEERVRERTAELVALNAELEHQNTELELQTVELEDRQAQLGQANDELEAQQAELERTLSELDEEKARIELFYRFGELLAAKKAIEPLAQTALSELARFANAEIATLYAIDDEETAGSCVLLAGLGLDPNALPARLSPGEGLAGRALAERHVIETSHGESGLRLPAFGRQIAARHELHLPLVEGERAFAVISLARVEDRRFSPDELRTIEHLVGQSAVALANTLSFRRSTRLAAINRAVLDATPEGIALVDLDGKVLLVNAALTRLAELHGTAIAPGASSAEIVQAAAKQTTDPKRYLAESAASRDHPDREFVAVYQLAESGRWFERRTGPFRDSTGSIVGRIFTIREITAEQEAERLKDELIATVSHELRTPLTSIYGFAELLAERELDAETRMEYLSTIHREAQRLSELVDDFLDLQRIEQARFTVKPEPLELGQLLREQIETFVTQSERHALELELPDEPLEVSVDRARLVQVIENLLSNALKYSPAGGRVGVTASRRAGVVRVSVSDEGLGIPAAQQSQVFARFFRVDSSDTREIGGTGLGLTIAKEIVEAHGGRIGFESVEGQGSTFWLELPAG